MQTWTPLDRKVSDARGLVLGPWVLRLKRSDRRLKLARVILTMIDRLKKHALFACEGLFRARRDGSRSMDSSERREDLDRGIGKICDW